VAIILYFSVGSISFSLLNKKIYNSTVCFTGALFLYVLWYFFIGKYIFAKFTPHPLLEHIHQYNSIFKLLNPAGIKSVLNIYYNLLAFNIKLFPILILVLNCGVVILWKSRCYKNLLFVIFIIPLSFLLVYANVAGHSAILILPDMRYSYYLAPAFFLFYLVCIYICFSASFVHGRFLFVSILFLLTFSSLIHSYNYRNYYTLHVGEIGHLHIIESGREYVKNFESILSEHNIRGNQLYTEPN
jgi:hypothetical protein